MNNKELVNKALSIFWEGRASWTYLLGSTGLVAGTDAKVKNFFDYFQSIGRISSDFTYAQWLAKHKGKQTGDCSNTILNYLVYGNCQKGVASCWSANAPQSWEQVPMDKLKGGEVAWKSGHVGLVVQVDPIITIDIPGPSSLEAATFRKLDVTNQYGNYWSGFAKFPVGYVSYTEKISGGAKVVKKIEAKIKEGLKGGYTLTASDFTITVTYSDGSTEKNPQGWAAVNRTTGSLTLAEGTNRVYVIYKNVSTEIDYVTPGGVKMYSVTMTVSDVAALKKICPGVVAKEV